MSTKNDIRYPYTHAADFIRCMAGHTAEGSKLSRSDASMIRQGVAVALGMPDEEVAKRLADCYLVNLKEITERAFKDAIELSEALNKNVAGWLYRGNPENPGEQSD